MSHAKHPLIAAHRPHAAPHLIRQRLKPEPMIRRGQGTRNRILGALLLLRMYKDLNRLLKSALQQMRVALEWDVAVRFDAALRRQIKAMDRIKKKQCANSLVKI